MGGDWVLLITDRYSGDTGSLDAWEIHACYEIAVENPDIFADGFESGDTVAWSSTVQ